MKRQPIALNQDWFAQPYREARPVVTHPRAPANDNEWLSQFVSSPSEIPMDDDHDEIEGFEDEDFRPSLLVFLLGLILALAAIFATILPGEGL